MLNPKIFILARASALEFGAIFLYEEVLNLTTIEDP